MKGITPIISIIILLLITIALAGVAYTFLMGQMFTRIGGAFDIPVGGAFCVSNGTFNLVTVQIVNTGTTSISSGDFTIAQIDGADVTTDPAWQSVTVPSEESDILIRNYDCNTVGGCSSGFHTIDIGTKSMVKHENVHCP